MITLLSLPSTKKSYNEHCLRVITNKNMNINFDGKLNGESHERVLTKSRESCLYEQKLAKNQ